VSEFLFVYRGGRRSEDPAEGQRVMQRWTDWMKNLSEKGHLKDMGSPVEPEGRVVRGTSKTVSNGAFTDGLGTIGGYSVVEARDLGHAVELSKGCPIFEVDGLVEVRPIMSM